MPKSNLQIALFLIGITLFILLLIFFIMLITNIYQKKQLNHLLTLEKIKIYHTNSLLNAKINIQEETFLHISKEIHDNIGQKLSLMKLTLNCGNRVFNENTKQCIQLLDEVLYDLKAISKGL